MFFSPLFPSHMRIKFIFFNKFVTHQLTYQEHPKYLPRSAFSKLAIFFFFFKFFLLIDHHVYHFLQKSPDAPHLYTNKKRI